MNEADVLAEIKSTFEAMFGIDPETLRGSARLEEDLDLDSIDAVDLVATMEKKVGRRIAIEEFKSIKTLDDLVQVVHRALRAS